MGFEAGSRHRRYSPNRNSARRVLCAAVLPFVIGFLLVVTFYRNSSSDSAEVLKSLSDGLPEPQPARISRSNPGSGTPLNLGSDPSLLRGSKGAGAATAVVKATGSEAKGSSADDSSSTAQPASRPELFLFIGILSGRGYRHRRLAVREAWANRAQAEPVTIARFVLSEDEQTPQVSTQYAWCCGWQTFHSCETEDNSTYC